MLLKAKHYLSVAVCFARISIQSQIEYPLFLISWALAVPLQGFAGVLLLKVIVDRFNPIAGWTFPQLAFLYGLGLLSSGLMVILFIRTWGIESLVIEGGFDRMLLRPMGIFFQLQSSYFNFIGFFDIFPAVVIFIYGCKASGFVWSLSNIIKLLLVIFGGVLIYASYFTISGSVAFWTKRSRSLLGIGWALLERTTQYPLIIYPRFVQIIFTFILPFGFISFYPSCDFLGKDERFILPAGLAIWTPVVGVLMFILAHSIFNLGLKKYEGSGS